jgi:DNA-binding NtrC family response regulator
MGKGLNAKELMAARKAPTKTAVMLVEADVLVRYALAEHMRACNITVIEAVSADDAKAILIVGPAINVLFSDTQLAGEGSGFVLAQWVRRHRPAIRTVLTGSVASKAQAVTAFTASIPDCPPNGDATLLEARLNAMMAQRKRRLRASPKLEPLKPKRKRA